MISAAVEPAEGAKRVGSRGVLRRAWGLGRTRVGVGILLVVLAIAVFGPLVAPYSSTQFVGAPVAPPGHGTLFGTDILGRDVFSRFLDGGRTVVGLSLAAAIIGVGLGAVIGISAAYFRGFADELLMRTSDIVLSFPQIVLVLLLVSGLGSHAWLLVLTIAAGHAPRTARVIRGAAQDVVERDFVLASDAMGERRWRILVDALLPNVSSPLLVEFGMRFTFSIGLVAGISFLGLGLQPPTADWGLMINENRIAIMLQPWAVMLPVAAIGLLAVGANLLTDGLTHAVIGIDVKKSTKA